MAKEGGETVIRIVKKKGGHGAHHGGAWKVAYADFVTAMMALFIVLWIVAQNQEIRESVAGYFRDPGVFETGRGGLLSDDSGGGQTILPSPEEQFQALQESRFREAARLIEEELRQSPGLTELGEQVDIQITKEGLRLELVETPESFFFNIGTSDLAANKREILAIIAEQLGQLPNPVIIEGHTDSRQYARLDGYTNFELSTDRANSARRFMVTRGLRAGQVKEIRGYADSRLRNPDNPLDPINRRISLLIRYDEYVTPPGDTPSPTPVSPDRPEDPDAPGAADAPADPAGR